MGMILGGWAREEEEKNRYASYELDAALRKIEELENEIKSLKEEIRVLKERYPHGN